MFFLRRGCGVIVGQPPWLDLGGWLWPRSAQCWINVLHLLLKTADVISAWPASTRDIRQCPFRGQYIRMQKLLLLLAVTMNLRYLVFGMGPGPLLRGWWMSRGDTLVALKFVGANFISDVSLFLGTRFINWGFIHPGFDNFLTFTASKLGIAPGS